jgi:hypothetical protein
MPFSNPAVFILAIFILILIILVILLLAPFNLSLDIGKKGPLVWGSIKLAWLGLTLKKIEISPRSAGELLACIKNEEAQRGEQAFDESKTTGENEGRERGEKTDSFKTPSIHYFMDMAPPLTRILWDLLKSICFKMSTCRLCFGLNDPAQTAIVSGYLWFLASALGTSSAKVSIDPWFEGERLEGEIIAEIEARLLSPILAVIKAMRVREIRLLLREMRGWT